MSRQILISLEINQFRNLQSVNLTFSPRFNLFLGANATGKTSLLESLYVLARASSFRTRSLDKLIQTGTPHFQLLAKVQLTNRAIVPVGLLRNRKQLNARIKGQQVRQLSELAALFPIHWLGGDLHQLIEGGPAYRRHFLDWGMFHVKHDYTDVWKIFRNTLKQRNAALRKRSNAREVVIWDKELSVMGERLHNLRKDYVDRLAKELDGMQSGLLMFGDTLNVSYSKGWTGDASLKDSLVRGLDKDREQGFTRAGPQRADLEMRLGDNLAKDRLSRGQQKLLVIGLQIAQAQLLKERLDKTSLFLLDDLGAELDSVNQQRVMHLLQRIDAQVFATAINEPADWIWDEAEARKFHVKHGVISEVVV